MIIVAFVAVLAAVAGAAAVEKQPPYFQTSPELNPGPMSTGKPAFLAQTNPAPFPSISYIAPQPLETQVPIAGGNGGGNVFELMGQLSHYFSNPTGFGVDEHPMPEGAEIKQLHMLHRHGARFPTGQHELTAKLEGHQFNATGDLEFLNSWKNKLGLHILVPVGKQELFDSGTSHWYSYGHLHKNDGKKVVVRSTTQDRMTQSAEYFLAGFFGQKWTENATLELILESRGYNNSLAGYNSCNNSGKPLSFMGSVARSEWVRTYLKDAHTRLNELVKFDDDKAELTIGDVYYFQSMCAYETVALGYSAFCKLFTYDEWEGYEYSIDIAFAGNSGFQSPTSRAVGIGYVQELRARLTHHYLTERGGPANTTLDSMPETFPLDQSLYFDFSHDTNMMAVLTAFGLTQFAAYLPPTHIPRNRELTVSHLEPFAARLDIEIISAPRPVSASRARGDYDSDAVAKNTTYVHFLVNQRTILLGRSFKQCGDRDDGWCELGAFLDATASAWDDSEYEWACFGDYPSVPYGTVTDGRPSLVEPTLLRKQGMD